MTYVFDFGWLAEYWPVILRGIAITIQLIAVGGLLGVGLGIACAWARTEGPGWLGGIVSAYVELIRNTPFLIQLFFIFFGLPALGVQMSELTAANLAMIINLGAYSCEIIRAGIGATPKGQFEAGASLAMTPFETFRHVVLVPALQRIWPALSSQVVIVMLGSAVVSQIAAEDLTFAANFIQSRTFRAFEAYFLSTAIYLALAIALRQLLRGVGFVLFPRRGCAVTSFTTWDIVRNLLLAARWTVVLSLVSFVGGGIVGGLILYARIGRSAWLRWFAQGYIELFQGTPLLMQLFLAFFGLGLFGIDVPAWLAAGVALVLWTASFLAEIWRGCVEAIHKGQWEASASLGMGYGQQLRWVVFPQALRIAIPPTVGFSVQVVKGTALTSIIGFVELSKAGTVVTNATFEPFTVYGIVALIYFALCWPLSKTSQVLERKLNVAHRHH